MQKTTIIIANADIKHITREASRFFGGATAIITFGGWTDGAGDLHTEPGVQLTILHDDKHEAIVSWARAYGDEHGEECIVVTYNGQSTIEDCK